MISAMKGVQNSQVFHNTLGMAISNIMNQIVFGRRLEYDDPNFVAIQKFHLVFIAIIKANAVPFYKVRWRALLFGDHLLHV